MRISSKTEYALRTVLDLALHRHSGLVQVGAIAKRQKISPKFLAQILLLLKNGGIVESRRGSDGGYFLAAPPETIRVSQVVALMDDAFSHRPETKAHKSRTSNTPFDPFAHMWQEIELQVFRTLDGLTIQDMCKRVAEHAKSDSQEYAI